MTADQFTRLATLIRSEVGGLRSVMDERFTGVYERLEGNEVRAGRHFARIERRFDGLDSRLVALEAGQEQLRGDIKGVAEGVTTNGERIDRALGRLDGMDETLRDLANVATSSD